MLEIVGNFWDVYKDYDAIVCTTNGVVKKNTGELVMGAGIALQFRERFPGLAHKLGHRVATRGNYPTVIEVGNSTIISMPTKEHFREKSTLALVEKSAILVAALSDALSLERVLSVRPGCGLGGLHWGNVGKVLAQTWDDRFHIISKELS